MDCTELRGLSRCGHESALTPIDFETIATASPGNARHMDRGYRSVRQLSADENIVWRRDIDQALGIHLQPLRHLGRDHGGDMAKISHDKAHGIDGVPGGDGQGRSAQGVIALPGPIRRTLEHAIAQQTHMTGEHFTHIAGIDQLLQVQHCWRGTRLQAHTGLQASLPCQGGECLCLCRILPQRPFREDMLASLQRGACRLVVGGNP